MSELLFSLVIWISGVTGYPVPPALEFPQVILMKPAVLKAKVMGANADKSDNEVLGGYDVEENKIYLSTTFNPRDVRGQADLVHELVHFLQSKHRIHPPLCENSDEVEAYQTENRWMAAHGFPPSIPELHIALMSICTVDNVDDAIAAIR